MGEKAMKSDIVRYLLTAAGVIGLAGVPAAFAGDLRHHYREARRENSDIRRDERKLYEDREDGRYRRAARDRAELNRDYRERDREIRDIRHDRRDLRQDEAWRYGWR